MSEYTQNMLRESIRKNNIYAVFFVFFYKSGVQGGLNYKGVLA